MTFLSFRNIYWVNNTNSMIQISYIEKSHDIVFYIFTLTMSFDLICPLMQDSISFNCNRFSLFLVLQKNPRTALFILAPTFCIWVPELLIYYTCRIQITFMYFKHACLILLQNMYLKPCFLQLFLFWVSWYDNRFVLRGENESIMGLICPDADQ